MIFLLQVYVLSDSKRLTPCSYIREITKEKHKQSMLFRVIESYLVYKQDVDYKVLNKVIVTLAIYHRSRMQGASVGKPLYKHHAYAQLATQS